MQALRGAGGRADGREEMGPVSGCEGSLVVEVPVVDLGEGRCVTRYGEVASVRLKRELLVEFRTKKLPLRNTTGIKI